MSLRVARKIPTRSRYSSSDYGDRERRLRLLNQQAEEQRENYEAKREELRNLVDEETKKLQNVIEANESALKNLKILEVREDALLKNISKLERDILEASNRLKAEINRRTKFVDSSKQELKRGKDLEKLIKRVLLRLDDQIKDLLPVVKELEEFIKKESIARERFLSVQSDLQIAEKKKTDVLEKTKKEKEKIKIQFEELDKSKKSIADMSSKLGNFAYEISLTIQYLNRKFKDKDIPVEYDLAPEIKKIILK